MQCQFFVIQMRKNILQGHSSASELESRLNRHRYISKQMLPGGSDAKVFDALKKSQHVPDRKLYPNIYHWYILIRQFSDHARTKWIANDTQNIEDDDLIKQLLNDDSIESDRNENQKLTQNKQDNGDSQEILKGQIALTPRNSGITISKEDVNDPEFFLNIFSKQNLSSRIQEVMDRALRERENKLGIQVTQIKVQDTSQGKSHFIYFKASQSECEELKDIVSHWPEVLSFSIKKQKKKDSRM